MNKTERVAEAKDYTLIPYEDYILYDTETIPLYFLGSVWYFKFSIGQYMQLFQNIVKLKSDTNMYCGGNLPYPQIFRLNKISYSADVDITKYRDTSKIKVLVYFSCKLFQEFTLNEFKNNFVQLLYKTEALESIFIKIDFTGDVSDVKYIHLGEIDCFRLKINLHGTLYKTR